MTERERQGGVAALTALVNTPLKGAIGADGCAASQSSTASSNGNGAANGSSNGSSSLPVLPPDAYVWVQPAEVLRSSNSSNSSVRPSH
jgi:hypothetical protein